MCWEIFHDLSSSKLSYSKSSFRNPSETNSWDPDQAKSFVGPDLDPNCF